MIHLATPQPGQPDPFLQAVVSAAVFAAIVSGVFLIAQVFLNKRLRAPSDKLAEAQFSVKVYQDQVAEAREDKKLNDETISTLRDYVSKMESDSRTDQQLITDLYKQIRALEERNAQKDAKIAMYQARIDAVAAKIARGETVTLNDLLNRPGSRLEDED